MPLSIAFGNAMMGEVRRLDPMLIPFYNNLCMVIIGIVVCSFNDKGFMPSDEDFSVHPSWLYWLLTLVCNGLSTFLSWHFQIMAFRYDRVSRVAPVFYLESVFALVFDFILFDESFGALQIVGLVLVIGVFGWIVVEAYLSEEKSSEQAKVVEKGAVGG